MERVLRLTDRTVDLDTGKVDNGEQLRPMELKVLRHLAERPEQIVSQRELLVSVWGYTEGTRTRTAYTTLHRLRQVLEIEPGDPRHLQTVPGKGVQLVDAGGERLPQTNLKPALDVFVGRRDLLGQLERSSARLVTLLGMGGVGKTRLATEYAWRSLERFPAGCWFCDLSSANTVSEAAERIAGTLGLTLRDADAELGRALAGKGEVLLVVDNLESVDGSMAEAITGWLQQAPEARFVATSRTPVGVKGEQRVFVGPLAVPTIAGGDALDLFVARAQAANPSFDPAPVRASLLALLAALDHLPLAIELAAGQAAMVGPEATLATLEQSGRLGDGAGLHPARQRSLDDVVAWSWERLSTDVQHGGRCLAAFAGSFALPAAQAVLDATERPCNAQALVVELLERGLLRRTATAGPPRFALFAIVRRFLAQHPLPDGAVDGHTRYYRALAQGLFEASQRMPMNTDPYEGALLDEVLLATRRQLAIDPEAALPLVLWGQVAAAGSSRASVALELAQRALDTGLSAESSVLVRLRFELDLRRRGRQTEADALRESLPVEAVAAGRPDLASFVVHREAMHLLNQGHFAQAQQMLERSIALFDQVPDPPAVLESTLRGGWANLRGAFVMRTEDPAAAEALYREAISHYQRIELARDVAAVRMNLGTALAEMGRLSEAEQQVRASVEGLPRRWRIQRCIALTKLALVLDARRDFDGALDASDAAVALAEAAGDREVWAYALALRASTLLDVGEVDEAIQINEQLSGFDLRGVPAIEVRVLSVRGRVAAHAGQADALPILERALEVAGRVHEPFAARQVALHLANHLVHHGRLSEALQVMSASVEHAPRTLSADRARVLHAELLRCTGDSDTALQALDALKSSGALGVAALATLARSALMTERGDAPELRAPQLAEHADPWSRVYAARLHTALGDSDAARALVHGVVPPVGDGLLERALRELTSG